LPVPGGACAQEQHEAPQGEVEQALAQIWAQVLEVAQVGRHDNFFELGGDSILSIQIKAQAQQQGLQFALEALFERQTVARLAEVVTLRDPAVHVAARLTAPFALVDADVRARLPEGLEDAYPLSHMQAGMLFHSDLDRANSAYHDIFHFRIRADVDPARIAAVLHQLGRRHAVLRTAFDLGFVPPLQLVHAQAEIPLAFHDLMHLEDWQQDAELQRWMEREKHEGIDVRRAPVVRAAVFLLGARAFEVGLSFHHAILDGWSLATLTTQFVEDYAALCKGRTIDWSVSGAYRDYVALEMEAVESDAHRSYWETQLRDFSPSLLPTGVGGATGATQRTPVEISQAQSRQLQDLAKRWQVPFKSMLLAVHLKALSVITGQRDVTTGLVTNGRPESAEAERLAGLFLNTVPFRLHAESESWRDRVGRVAAHEHGLWAHRRYPMPLMKRWVDGGQLFNTALNYTHFHVLESVIDGSEDVTLIGGGGFEHAHFDLIAQCGWRADSHTPQFTLETNGARTPPEVAALYARIYQQALCSLLADPLASCDALDAVPERDRQQLLSWAGSPGAGRASLSGRFAQVAQDTPQAVAVQDAEGTLSYAQLEAASAAIAAALRRSGVQRGMRVGVSLARS
ncbi:condensation domain-containing protein, partial [Xanthomonas melonis]|uniref:condensation domain-containing protein n=1 Tax=Xanthomonas melonis TaxID=56456 RepID=UPI003EBF7F48